MASITDMLVGSVLEQSQKAPDISAGISQGAQLAQAAENMRAQREQLEMKKQEQQMSKVDRLTEAMSVGAKIASKSARNAYFKEYIPKMQAALGLQDFIPPETMAMIQADPEQAKKFSLLKTKIMNDEMTFDQAVAQMDPEAWAMLDDREVLQMEAAEKFRIQQQESTARASAPGDRLAGQFATNKALGIKKEFDQNTRKDFERYTAANNALALLKSDLPIADEASKTQLARLSGEVGNLTEQDLARFGGSKDLKERASQLFKTASEGKLTPGNRRQLVRIADEFKAIVDAKIRAQAARSVKGAKALRLDTKTVEELIDVEGLLSGGNVQSSAQSGPKDKKVEDYAAQYNMSYEQALGILTKRGYKPGGK